MKMARPIYHNIKGAPFSIGRRVQVLKLVDNTGNTALVGRMGRIEYYEYSCGCGQTYPSDPMIGLRFSNGTLEEFWTEELRTLKRRAPRLSIRGRR